MATAKIRTNSICKFVGGVGRRRQQQYQQYQKQSYTLYNLLITTDNKAHKKEY